MDFSTVLIIAAPVLTFLLGLAVKTKYFRKVAGGIRILHVLLEGFTDDGKLDADELKRAKVLYDEYFSKKPTE